MTLPVVDKKGNPLNIGDRVSVTRKFREGVAKIVAIDANNTTELEDGHWVDIEWEDWGFAGQREGMMTYVMEKI